MKYIETARRMSAALNGAGLKPSELAELSGVSKASISQYLNGSHVPSNISSSKMAPVLNVSPLWLMGLDVPVKGHAKFSGCVEIPILGRVAAGLPIDAVTDIIGTIEVPEEMEEGYFALQIKGDSMTPLIYDKDVVIVRQQPSAESGEIIIANIGNNEAVCKRMRHLSGGIELISDNPSYIPLVFSFEMVEKLQIRILGKVVELRRKF